MKSCNCRCESAFYLGVGCTAAAVLMTQVIQTRIISVTSWYHLAFFAISTAMFGMTAAKRLCDPKNFVTDPNEYGWVCYVGGGGIVREKGTGAKQKKDAVCE